jgi:hypothetical protein
MCWSAPVSMNTWLLAIFAAVIGLYNGQLSPASAAFFLSFASMQLVEYFLWSFPALNATFSAVGLGLIAAQPLFSVLQLQNAAQRLPLLGAYTVFAAYTLYIAMNPTDFGISWRTSVARNGHLLWHWLPSNSVIFMVLYMALLFIPLALGGFHVGLLAGAAALLVSYYTYAEAGTWGSMWCWFASLMSLWVIGCSVLRRGSCAT